MILDQIVNGATIGSIYALIALGYCLVFSILGVVNFTHGAVLMTGAFIGVSLAQRTGFWAAIVLAASLTALFGVLVEKIALYPLRLKGAPNSAQFIGTIAVGMMIEIFVLMVWGPVVRPFQAPFEMERIQIGSAAGISYYELAIMAICGTLMIALQMFITKSKYGKAIRATSQNPRAAALMGVDIHTITSIVFAIGAALAGVAGVLIGVYYNAVDLGMGPMAGTKGFVAAVFGGIGSLPGAVLGGMLLGIMESIGSTWASSYRDVIAFCVLITVLLVKPNGLLGRAKVEKV